MTIVNLTPHPITLHRADGTVRTIQPEPVSARVATTTRAVGEIDGVPIIEEHYGHVTGLPDPKPGVVYVVARVVAAACPERRDLLVPADLVRSADGTVIGCRALARSTPAQDAAVVYWSIVRGSAPGAEAVEPGPLGIPIPDEVAELGDRFGLGDDPDVYVLVAPAELAGEIPGELAHYRARMPYATALRVWEAIEQEQQER